MKKLVKNIKTPKEVSFFNKSSGETEKHTYIFDINKGKTNENNFYCKSLCRAGE